VRVNLHIDRIVVNGTSLTRREREQLARTLEQELGHQLRVRITGAQGERGSGRHGTSQLAGRIATEVLAALPVGTFPVGGAAASPGRRP
jgi:hypothetical protein